MMLTAQQARDFRLELWRAREDALKDAEAFEGIIHVVERLGQFLFPNGRGLGDFKPAVCEVAEHSALAKDVPFKRRNVHMPFRFLYNIVKNGRNDALHIGAYARHLTTHAIELALALEDALRMIENPNMETANFVSDYMVREPVCAELWHPVSFIRQRMLTNSFSYLPVKNTTGEWCLVSDLQIAKYLQGCSNRQRGIRLSKTLEEALKEEPEIVLHPAKCLNETGTIDQALKTFDVDRKLILVFTDTEQSKPVGILTAFDLL